MASSSKVGTGCAYVFCAALAGVGLLLLWAAQTEWRRSGLTKETVFLLGIGSLLFLGGVMLIGPIRRAVAKQAAAEARQAQFPDQPWKWKEEWDGRPIESGDRKGAGFLLFFAVMWNAISWPAFWAVWWGPKENPIGVKVMVTLFPAIGVLVAWLAGYKWIQSRKFGRPRFVPSTVPGVIGGYVGGVIEVPARVTPEGDATLSLRNLRRETRGSGKNRSTTEVVLWEREERIPREKWASGAGRTDIPVLFHVPDSCSATDASDPNNEVVWRLETKAAVAGVDFAATFDVPVFATGETAAPPERNEPLLAEYKAGPPDATVLAAAGVRAGADGASWHFSSPGMPGAKVGFTVVALGFGAGTVMAFLHGPLLLALFLALFAALMTAAAADLWFDGQELVIDGRDVIVRRRRPWGVKEQRVPRAEVEGFRAEKSMSVGTTQYYRLKLVGAPGADPAQPREGEPFVVCKLRHELRVKGDSVDLRQLLARAPKFEIVIAKHVPNLATAERVGELVLGKIRGK
jgi:hypothetical protein